MEHSVAKKLEALTKLQKIDISLDEIFKIRGALPEEVMDLEDEITGYQTRVENLISEMKNTNTETFQKGMFLMFESPTTKT